MLEVPLPRCPACQGDIIAFHHPEDATLLVWACRACGETYTIDSKGELRALVLQLFDALCPDCGGSMHLSSDQSRQVDRWYCRARGAAF